MAWRCLTDFFELILTIRGISNHNNYTDSVKYVKLWIFVSERKFSKLWDTLKNCYETGHILANFYHFFVNTFCTQMKIKTLKNIINTNTAQIYPKLHKKCHFKIPRFFYLTFWKKSWEKAHFVFFTPTQNKWGN